VDQIAQRGCVVPVFTGFHDPYDTVLNSLPEYELTLLWAGGWTGDSASRDLTKSLPTCIILWLHESDSALPI